MVTAASVPIEVIRQTKLVAVFVQSGLDTDTKVAPESVAVTCTRDTAVPLFAIVRPDIEAVSVRCKHESTQPEGGAEGVVVTGA